MPPVNWLALFSCSCAPLSAVNTVAVATVKLLPWAWRITPPSAFRLKLPTSTVPRLRSVALVRLKLPAVTLTLPPKSLALFSVTDWPAAVNWLAPPTVNTPLSVTAPAAVTLRLLTFTVPKSSADDTPTVKLCAVADSVPVVEPLTLKAPAAVTLAVPALSSTTLKASTSVTATVPAPRTVMPPVNWLALFNCSCAPLPAVNTVAPDTERVLPTD